jgi:hypothetical protein
MFGAGDANLMSRRKRTVYGVYGEEGLGVLSRSVCEIVRVVGGRRGWRVVRIRGGGRVVRTL